MNSSPQLRQEAKQRYIDGENTIEIARSMRVSGETIRQWLHKLGVEIRRRPDRQQKYSHRSDCFSSMTPSATDAYFAGLLLADGNVQKKSGLIQISILASDAYLLHALKRHLAYTGPIKYFSRRHRSGRWGKMSALRVIAHDLLAPLAAWGVVPQKSKRGFVGPAVRSGSLLEEYFYRGLFDGDGCVHKRRNKKGLYLSLGGTPAIIDAFRDWCWRSCREAGSLHKRSATFHVVQFGGRAAAAVGEQLYRSKGAPKMHRKVELIKCVTKEMHLMQR